MTVAVQIKQMHNTNRKQQLALFKENDLVYILTKNISFQRD